MTEFYLHYHSKIELPIFLHNLADLKGHSQSWRCHVQYLILLKVKFQTAIRYFIYDKK